MVMPEPRPVHAEPVPAGRRPAFPHPVRKSQLRDQLHPHRDHPDKQHNRRQRCGFFYKSPQHLPLPCPEHRENIVPFLFWRQGRRSAANLRSLTTGYRFCRAPGPDGLLRGQSLFQPERRIALAQAGPSAILNRGKRGRAPQSEDSMNTRLAVTGLLAVPATSTMAPAAVQAQGSSYPVRLRVYGPVGYDECNYTSIAQCKASASGRPADCYPNAFAAAPATPTGRHIDGQAPGERRT